MRTTRRRFLTGAAASGAVLISRPPGALAQALRSAAAPGADRASRLTPGRWLVHADLHNHTLFSDGDGDPADAFASMRDNGLDVAALTDHAVLGGPLGVGMTGAIAAGCGSSCTSVRGIDDASWADAAALAAGADEPGVFTAIRGFEWSSPTLGHVNVWFGQDWIDPERTAGLVGVEGLPGYLDEVPTIGPGLGEPLESLVTDAPTTGAMMVPFFEWLKTAPGAPILGGGSDALAGFNHPGREPGRFGRFHFDAQLQDRIVSLELFNRNEDYLFEGTDRGQPSPLVECLAAGWKPGLLGVTDEHGTDWGAPVDKGRAGLWVTELTRAGVQEALAQRRFFATRERGLRVDATIGGVPMGGTLAHAGGPVEIALDVDGGPAWVGRRLVAQVLRPGSSLPEVAHEVELVVPGPEQPVIRFSLPLDIEDGPWLVLRLVDPDAEPDGRAIGALAGGRAIAYVSPVYLVPASPAAPVPVPSPTEPLPPPPEGGPAPVPGPTGTLPATGIWSGPRAVAAGLAAGASLAGVAALRRTGHAAGHPHVHGGHTHVHDLDRPHHHDPEPPGP